MNLLQETKEAIKDSGHKIGDIVFIGSVESGHSCTWKQFTKLSDFEYDNGFGGQEVATDLIVAFDDGATMWRHEYDGSENWDYSTPFSIPKVSQSITTLCTGEPWSTLAQMNRKGGKYGSN